MIPDKDRGLGVQNISGIIQEGLRKVYLPVALR